MSLYNTVPLIKGTVFGCLTVCGRAGSNRQGSTTWLCLCSCGSYVVLSKDHLTRKKQPVRSCGCLKKQLKGSNSPHWGGVGDISGNWWSSHVLRERRQTKRTSVPVTVTIEQAWDLFLKQEGKCALSGVPLVIDNIGKYNTASIDRIDSSKGYEINNIQWVHKDVNFMKRNYSQEYFIEMCSKIANHNKKPSAGAARLLEEQNQARRELGLPELSIKLRKCMQCRVEFLSVEARTCDKCLKEREEIDDRDLD